MSSSDWSCYNNNGRYEYVPIHGLISFYQRTGSTQMVQESPWTELKAQWRLLLPSIILTLLQYSSAVVTDSIAGHLGKFELASFAMASACMRIAYALMLGMGSALETLCGQAFGAREYDMLGIYAQRSVVILLITAILLSLPCFFSEPLLKFIGQSTDIAEETSLLLRWMLPQLFACALNFPLQNFLYSQSLITPLVWISICIFLPQMFLSWIAAFKLNLGVVGIAMIQNASGWLFAVCQFLYIARSESCKSSWTGFSICAFHQLLGFVRLSFFSSIMICLQMWYYQILVLFAGTLSDPEVQIDALIVCINLIFLEATAPFGFRTATSIRVSNELGAGNSLAASFSVFVAMAVASIFSLLLAMLFFLLRSNLGYIFTDSSAVVERVADLVPFLSATIVLCGLQSVLTGAATGSGWQSYVAYVNIICCYLVGLPLGLLICYKLDMGITGIWSGMIAGSALQNLIILYMTWNANWSEQANQAIEFMRSLRQNSCSWNGID